jgi:hypothetical protein
MEVQETNMSTRISRKNLWLGLAVSIVLSFAVTIPITWVVRSHGYCLDAWSFLPINFAIGFVCWCVGFFLFPVTPTARDDEGGGGRI